MILRNLLKSPCLLAAVLLLAACATGPVEYVECPGSTGFRDPLDLAVTKFGTAPAATASRSYEQAIIRVLEARAEGAAAGRSLNIAVLSGGGQYGAYGAGFMDGWHKNSGDGIVFDLVTGISTGALQSVPVFLGEKADYAFLTKAYSIKKPDKIAVKRWSLFGIPLENSQYSLSPLREKIEDYITPDRLKRIAAAADAERLLMVGVVDAEDGLFHAFNLTALASAPNIGKETKRKCFIEVLMASAAVPGVFPPIYIDGHQYFDGGVRRSVFKASTANALLRFRRNWVGAAKREATVPTDNLYMVFNGYLGLDAAKPEDNSILNTLKRTAEILLDQIEEDSIEDFRRLEGFDVRWTYIREGLCAEKAADADEHAFDAPFMRCLVKKGRDIGSASDPWSRL